jgi:hypothetical protein
MGIGRAERPIVKTKFAPTQAGNSFGKVLLERSQRAIWVFNWFFAQASGG